MRIGHTSLTWVAIVLALVAACCCGLWFSLTYSNSHLDEWFRPKDRARFVQAEWAKSRFGQTVRYAMANDLVSSGALTGVDEGKVLRLLGSPDRRYRGAIGQVLTWDLVSQDALPAGSWFLPKRLFMNVDSWALDVEFLNGRTRSARIRST